MRGDAWASGGSTILVVDDEHDIRESILDVLQAALPDARVLAAASGEEGLERLLAHHVDVIVTDYRLDGMDGLEFLRAAHRLAPQAACILITAFADLEVPEAALAGVDAVILKPLDAGALVAQVLSATAQAGRAPAGRPGRPGPLDGDRPTPAAGPLRTERARR
jgi:CheY-like chemotaxis protein